VDVFVARQPIFDPLQRVTGYELLFRNGPETFFPRVDGSYASSRVIHDSVHVFGLGALSASRRLYINVTRDILVAELIRLVPPEVAVVEILESIPPDPEVLAACRSLRASGYAIALDDFVPGSPAEQLVPFARFVKLDVLALKCDALTQAARRLLQAGVSVVAEKVETAEQFERARAAGCSLFQGYYFCRPVTFSGRALPANQLTQMRLVAALNQSSVSLATIEDLLKHDASLSYRVLRSVNSAGFGLRREIHSIREALLLLGLDQVRKWSSIWALAGLNKGPSELVTMTVIRARCCELLGQALDRSDHGAAFFLLGLCSLLDVLLGHPMAQVTGDLPLEPEIRDALLGTDNPARRALDAVVHYEQGRWDEAARATEALGIGPDALPDAYADALGWARKLTASIA
jgi:EAL and modified HD-GYP domain-containing signal transduction protein